MLVQLMESAAEEAAAQEAERSALEADLAGAVHLIQSLSDRMSDGLKKRGQSTCSLLHDPKRFLLPPKVTTTKGTLSCGTQDGEGNSDNAVPGSISASSSSSSQSIERMSDAYADFAATQSSPHDGDVVRQHDSELMSCC